MEEYETDLKRIILYNFGLEAIRNQNYIICLEAVRGNGLKLKDVKWDELDLTKEEIENLNMEAVKQNPYAISYVKEQTDKVCIKALEQSGYAIYEIKNKDKYIKMFDIRFLEKIEKIITVVAIRINREWLFTVKNEENLSKEEFIYWANSEKISDKYKQIYLEFANNCK
ncbi:TPA: hypothetical protein KOB88_002481 [Clostridioides difficile]|uniref:hypothetical protein n=1 Tax=Clostridioides difficile TaxID=1496 RepID=UPI0003B2897E|nr:hypothetical protein [Clostridioides difficile]MDW0077014.1 hypothetical protein [Clostridioides difficile]CCL32338.1 hypothetical protein BN174_4030005 [Clostridioides difficile E15]HBF3307556.1 hypothetical protein [Clostridioides difficile]HBG4629778.1 hypothetical protein [Clostridioides difficile]